MGKQISTRRKALQWSQGQLAEKVALAPDTISRFERGVTVPSLSKLQELAEVLNLRISDLFSEGSSSPSDQVETVLAWMRPLEPEERAFVLDLVKRTCDYMQQKRGLACAHEAPGSASATK
ncbi:helix-turn-helix domain-containing protein [Uliginosibacterium sp. 31-16]|uniref:helix-turn-helix domain-containing protein n=1 Tax=Uliginosibacterium sp. 31-16 TaxID=3068315 RepID=UPI0035321591